jgi:hypothetical protein
MVLNAGKDSGEGMGNLRKISQIAILSDGWGF